MKRIFLAIVDENFPVNDRQKQKSRKLTDNMQNKYWKIFTGVYHIQTIENQTKRKCWKKEEGEKKFLLIERKDKVYIGEDSEKMAAQKSPLIHNNFSGRICAM